MHFKSKTSRANFFISDGSDDEGDVEVLSFKEIKKMVRELRAVLKNKCIARMKQMGVYP